MAIDPSNIQRNDPQTPADSSAFHAADELAKKIQEDRKAKKIAEEKKQSEKSE